MRNSRVSLTIALLVVLPIALFGQKIDAAYAGKFVTHENVLSIRSKGQFIDGTVYLNANEKLVYVGKLQGGSSLLGAVVFNDGAEALANLQISGDSLVGTLLVGKDTLQCLLFLIGKSETFNPLRFFVGSGELEHDQALVGTWVRIKHFQANGQPMKSGRYVMDLEQDGTANTDKQSVKEFYRKFNSINHSNLKPPPESQWPRITWRTQMNTLIFGSDQSALETVLTYKFSMDTLNLVNSKGQREVYIRTR